MLLSVQDLTQSTFLEESKTRASKLGLFNSVMGHVGDGNFHQMVMYNPDDVEQKKAVQQCVDDMMVKAIEMEGTVSVGSHWAHMRILATILT